jgi:hypothetical protein
MFAGTPCGPKTWLVLACALILGAGAATRARADLPPSTLALATSESPRSIDVLPLLQESAGKPELVLAQRTITRDIGKKTNDVGPEPEYAYVDIEGWKNPGQASLMSAVVPGTGQLYAGSNRGYIFLGIEAVAMMAFIKYNNDSHEKRDTYYGYVGDPTQTNSRFSFTRLEGTVPPQEIARLEEIYAKDPREFYDEVTTNDALAAGWSDQGIETGQRSQAATYMDEVNNLDRKSNFGLATLIANHLVATVDALHLARINNIALKQNLTLKIKARPLGHRQSYGFTLTQKF